MFEEVIVMVAILAPIWGCAVFGICYKIYNNRKEREK